MPNVALAVRILGDDEVAHPVRLRGLEEVVGVDNAAGSVGNMAFTRPHIWSTTAFVMVPFGPQSALAEVLWVLASRNYR